MKSDITRDTFVAGKHFSRVISQQGRVTLDADNNEQTSILLYYLRTLAADLIGPYAAPVVDPGFVLTKDPNGGLSISPGRYYVNGILLENDAACPYINQPYNPLKSNDPFKQALDSKNNDGRYWIYLDVWERLVTSIEDDSIRESALGGPDTCTRAQVTWQVRAMDVGQAASNDRRTKRGQWLREKQNNLQAQLAKAQSSIAQQRIQELITRLGKQRTVLDRPDPKVSTAACATPLDYLFPVSDAYMGARVDPGPRIVDACVTSPDSKYRGTENQLYRVEIHQGGVARAATFKWSRDNGSRVTAWLGTSGYDLAVHDATGFSAGNWVELIDDVQELQGTPGQLVRLARVEAGMLTVDQSGTTADKLTWTQDFINPKVRRWDHFETEDLVLQPDGSILIQETPPGTMDDAATWIALEDGVQVQFTDGGEYRTGDYWLIPARVATGNIEWPEPLKDATGTLTTQVAPHGVVHHFAPLGFVGWADGEIGITSCYCEFEPLSSCFNRGSMMTGLHLLRTESVLDSSGPARVSPGRNPLPRQPRKAGQRPRKKPK